MNEYILPLFLTAEIHEPGFWTYFGDVFNGVATLIAGGIALLVYHLKVKGDKRDAARILLMEIRNAEKSVTDIKNTNGVAETTFVMPVSSWFKFQHYFVADLDSDELILLNDFYNLCALVQKEVDRLKNLLPTSNEEKIKLTQEKLLNIAEQYKDDKDGYEKHKKLVLKDVFFPEKEWFSPDLPQYRILQHLPNIRYITTSSCGEKLKNIAKISS